MGAGCGVIFLAKGGIIGGRTTTWDRLGAVKMTTKMMILVLGVWLAGCSGPARGTRPTVAAPKNPADSPRIQKKCKKSHGICEYRVLPDVAASRAGKLSTLCSVIVPDAAPTLAKISFGLQVSGKKVRYRECHDLQLTLDGVPLPPRPSEYHIALGTGFVVEAVTLPLSADELSRLTTSRKIEYRLCKESGSVSQWDHDLLRAMYLNWKAQ